MFDQAFFGEEFEKRVREFSRSHEGLGVRVELATLEAERLDVLELHAGETGLRLVTRDDRLVFLPYANIAHLDVSLLRDHRIVSFEIQATSI